MRILYLNTDTTDSNELGLLLANRLQGDEIIIESYPAIAATLVMIVEFLAEYDIIIFDGTIENDAELNNSKYDFWDSSILLRDNFFVVTRNTLPMNVVPPHSNLNLFVALRNNIYQVYQVDRNKDSSIDETISNEAIVDWVQQEIKKFVTTHKDYHRPETSLDVLGNLKNDVNSVMAQHDQSQKKQIFVSFRGRYQTEKYYGFNVDDVKNWIKNIYHENDPDEWDEPFIYDSSALTSELLPEQRLWTVKVLLHPRFKNVMNSGYLRPCKNVTSTVVSPIIVIGTHGGVLQR